MAHLYLTLLYKIRLFYAQIKLSLFLASNDELNISYKTIIRIRKQDDPLKIIPPFFITKLIVTSNSDTLTFSGSDIKFSLSLEKAISELSEWLFQVKHEANTLNRSGIASHKDPQKAKLKSYLEILERDTFLMFFLSEKVSFNEVLLKDLPSFQIRVLKVPTIDKEVDVIISSLIYKKKSQLFIGLSAYKNKFSSIQTAINHAIQESLMIYFNWGGIIENYQTDQNKKLKMLRPHYESSFKAEILNKFLKPKDLESITFEQNFSFNQYDKYKIVKIGNRFVCFGEIDNCLKLRFNKSWESSREEYYDYLKRRSLSIDLWDYHPLL